MGFIIKFLLKRALPFFFIFVAATSLLSLRSCAESVGVGGGSSEATMGNCEGAGVLDPANPFTGWPVAGGADWGKVTATFCDPVYLANLGNIHYGFDLGYPTGAGTLASADGVVVRAEMGHALRGNNIKICHVNGYCATYMHLDTLQVGNGDSVTLGQQIGTIGNTGNSTGPHLHFEIHNPAGIAIDPAPSL
ncbi:MAG: M23 family metallopeptidase [Chloroflexota bacterium]